MAEDRSTTPHSFSFPAVAAKIAERLQRLLQWIPAKARLSVCAGSVVLIVFALYMYLWGGSSVLNLVCQHSLKSADLTVIVDGNRIYSDHISGTVKRRFGFLDKKVEGTFSKSLTIPPGKHEIRINLTSAPDRFDQTKQVSAALASGKEATLMIIAQRNSLMLSYQGPQVVEKNDGNISDGAGIHSIFITVAGSAASAVIGFIVQEFLRKRKTGLSQN